jgi:hypothetical protein
LVIPFEGPRGLKLGAFALAQLPPPGPFLENQIGVSGSLICEDLDIVPRVKVITGERILSSGARASGGGGTAALAEVRRNIGGTTLARGVTLGGVLRLVEGKVSHLQTVGHFCD